MSATVVENNFLATDNILSGTLSIPLPQVEAGLHLCFNVPAFQLQLAVPIAEIDSDMEFGRVVFKAQIDDAVLFLSAIGVFNKDEDNFRIELINIHMERIVETARAEFIILTIRAVFVLAGDVYLRLPGLEREITLRFDEPLLNISQLLQRRQIDYRVMAIEKATGYRFQLSADISGEEVQNITFIYHAIVDRSFDWPTDNITVVFPATEEWRNRLTSSNQFNSFTLGPDPISRPLFGKQIFLGEGTVTLEDKSIERFDEVQQELARNDGHAVPVVIRTLSGHGIYNLPAAPRLPANPWDEKILGLIDLEDLLDETLVARYHALAASTLEGLDEEEKTAMTARPDLDEQAFSSDN